MKPILVFFLKSGFRVRFRKRGMDLPERAPKNPKSPKILTACLKRDEFRRKRKKGPKSTRDLYLIATRGQEKSDPMGSLQHLRGID